MIKIIKAGIVPKEQIECANCGSILEYENVDLELHQGYMTGYKYRFRCPMRSFNRCKMDKIVYSMKRFLGNALWLIFALPFYAIALLMCAYAFIVFTAIGFVFDKTKPYNMVDKIDDFVYKQVKTYLAS